MSLENTQSFTNGQRVAAGNVSASNDPSQWRHDGTEQLLKGAELAGAGRLLGMSEEETLAAVSRQYRRQRRADDRVSPQDVVRQMAQSLATTKSDVGSAEIEGVVTGSQMPVTTPENRSAHIQEMIMGGLTDAQILEQHPEISAADIASSKAELLESDNG